jgi:hypothetical protein
MTLRAIHAADADSVGKTGVRPQLTPPHNIACNTLPCTFTPLGLVWGFGSQAETVIVHLLSDVSLFGLKGAVSSSRPSTEVRRAQRRSTLAEGQRRRRRAAVLTAASTAPAWPRPGPLAARCWRKSRANRGEPAMGARSSRRDLVFGRVRLDPDHEAAIRFEGEAPGRRAHSSDGIRSHGPSRVTATSDRDQRPCVSGRSVAEITLAGLTIMPTLAAAVRRPPARCPS